MPRLKAMLMLSLATLLCAPVFGQNQNPASPGTLNYTEGQATINGQPITQRSVGQTDLRPGQVLTTTTGKVEVLLTPGVFLRVGDNSAVEMVSPNLTHTEVRLERGRADIEVDEIYKQNLLLVDTPQGQTQLLKNGLYAFNADSSTVRVFDGEADVFPGANTQSAVKPIKIKGDRQMILSEGTAKPAKFDKKAAENSLYQWSSLRSRYLGEANQDLAPEYADVADFTPGWYWAGGPFGYTWLPGDGLFLDPFGYGFYSPLYSGFGYGGGFYRGNGFYRGGYDRGSYGVHGSEGFHGGTAGEHGGYHAGLSSGGFHGGGSSSSGGGFHGGGGGGFSGGGGSHGGGGGGHR